jgi:hypothetical protein
LNFVVVFSVSVSICLKGLRFSSGFRVQGSGFRVQGSGFRVQGSGFRVQGSGFRVESSGKRNGIWNSKQALNKYRKGWGWGLAVRV